jgi:hypothetical protein
MNVALGQAGSQGLRLGLIPYRKVFAQPPRSVFSSQPKYQHQAIGLRQGGSSLPGH